MAVSAAELTGVEVPGKLIAPTPEITIEDLKTTCADPKGNDVVAGRNSCDWVLENVIGQE